MKNIYISVIFIPLILSTGVQRSLAEEISPGYQSQTVVVTATRTSQTAEESLSSVTVITREDIENQHVTSVQELLQSIAGVSIANSGGEGKLSALFMRGTESDHVLVLVDGIKIGSATTSTAAFQLIPVDQIERIEIVRGPRSSLYGSEAIGGVVQIFTRKGGGSLRPSVNLSVGEYDTHKALVGLSGGNKKSWFNISLSAHETNGFNACEANLGGGCFADEPDKDSFKSISGSAALGHQINASTVLDVNWLRANGNIKYDGFFNESDTVQQVLGAKIEHDISQTWNLTFSLGQSKDESDDFKDNVFNGSVNTKRNSATVQSEVLLTSSSELTVGIDYQDDGVDSTTNYAVTSRENKGVFAQYLHEFGQYNVQLSGRHDDNEQFGSSDTGSVAWGFDVSKQLRIIASYGTAFKAPSFNDLYYPGSENPNLTPEESETIELAVKGKKEWGKWAINIYQTKIDDLIVSNPPTWIPENVESALIRGAEFMVNLQIMNWDAQIDITLLDTENQSNSSNDGNELPRRAKKSARFFAGRGFGNYRLDAIIVAQGKRYDELANTTRLDSFYTADINAGYQYKKDWKFGVSAKNIFDKEYQTTAYYNQPGRNFLLSVSYQPSSL